jgi:hypothetical protein
VRCLLIYGKDFFRKWNRYDNEKDPVFNKLISQGTEEAKKKNVA